MIGAEEDALLAELARKEALVKDLERQREEAVARLGVLREQVAASRARARALPTSASPRASESAATPYTGGDKLKRFRELFRGREDVYPKYWEKPAEKRKGYSPVCGNWWKEGLCPKRDRKKVKCGECVSRKFLPVTDKVILDHFKGVHTIGVYPMLEDETCWFLAADFDKASWRVVVSLILASAFLHALWNALLKREHDPEVAAVAILSVAAILAIAAVPFASGPSFPGAHGLAWALAAGVCEGGYFLTLALGLRDAPLGVVYTIARGGALAAVWPISALWLGEAITTLTVVGVLTVAVGLALVSIGRSGHVSMRGILWAAVCALFIAGYHLCYKCALATGAEPTAVFATALSVALPINLGRLGRRGLPRVATVLRARPFTLVAAGALCSASFLVFLSALARGGAGAVVTLRNTSVVFALLLAWAIGERPTSRQVAGILGVALGAVLLGWPH